MRVGVAVMSDSDLGHRYARWSARMADRLRSDLSDIAARDFSELVEDQEGRYLIPGYYRDDVELPNGWVLPYFFRLTHPQTLLACVPRHCEGLASPCAGRCPLEPDRFRGKVCPVELYRLAEVFTGLADEFEVDPQNMSELQLIRQMAVDAVVLWRTEVLADDTNLVDEVAAVIPGGRGGGGEVVLHRAIDPQLMVRQQVQQHSARALELLLKRRQMLAEERRRARREEREEALLRLMERKQAWQERLADREGAVDSLTQLHQIIDSWSRKRPDLLTVGSTDPTQVDRASDGLDGSEVLSGPGPAGSGSDGVMG